MATEKELKEFIYHKNGWGKPIDKSKPKPKNGKLIATRGNQTVTIMEDKPFALLNWKKNELRKDAIWNGWQFKVTY